MQFLAITRRFTERCSQAEFDAALGPEADAARARYARGDFREIYSRGDVPGAVLLIEADSAEAARALMDELPMAQRGMMEIQIVPLRPYRGFIGG